MLEKMGVVSKRAERERGKMLDEQLAKLKAQREETEKLANTEQKRTGGTAPGAPASPAFNPAKAGADLMKSYQQPIREFQQKVFELQQTMASGSISTDVYAMELRRLKEEYAGLSPVISQALEAERQFEQEQLRIAQEVQATEDSLASPLQKYNAEVERLNFLRSQGLSEGAYARGLKAASDELNKDEIEKHNKLMEEGKQIMEQYKSPMQKYVDQLSNLRKLRKEGAIDQDTFTKAVKDSEEQLRQATAKDFEVRFSVSGIDSVEAGTTEALSQLADYRSMLSSDIAVGKVMADAKGLNRKTMMAEAGPRPPRLVNANKREGGPIQAQQFAEVPSIRQQANKSDPKLEEHLSRIAENTDKSRLVVFKEAGLR
jgi:hypothetical protein